MYYDNCQYWINWNTYLYMCKWSYDFKRHRLNICPNFSLSMPWEVDAQLSWKLVLYFSQWSASEMLPALSPFPPVFFYDFIPSIYGHCKNIANFFVKVPYSVKMIFSSIVLMHMFQLTKPLLKASLICNMLIGICEYQNT